MFNPGDSFPYIGLRPFSEEDSLYFKGRDEQILQLTALLEANKFLMVTGASGDGKSSLVYAGLVPNARAGFFKAHFANWVVADFRPERTPLHNLSKTISKNLRIGDDTSVEVELRRGFSSLLDLYTNSSLFVDEQSSSWKNASESERETMHRGAANLLIVADQFEEFFTNPENYYKNSPSADSQLVINLLLETARISIAKNLPVYIVCTMRSDYIGQCAAFRGLPEFIGFSQFFVPRLKRKEMVQVVKEPASLHGDKISNRLVERVVYDLGEGIDQLPVLEHAMNEVWIQAKNGDEELDLIHYAMAGGMPPNELPPDDLKKFDDWFSTLPTKLQEAYQRPGLSHIIDTHANKLYLSAADQYNLKHDKKISTADAQLIIKVAFICLTKMDEGRAVRNRMTLQEITDILAKPELTCDVVGGVLNIFREPGNTFLRPYISDDSESQTLKPGNVLDITHESLIRNWELLLTWAKEEFDHLTVYEDFKKQLDRWVASKKSRGFLLPIGPLTFFENWHDTLKPNKFWVNRYLDPGIDKETRLKEAQQIIDQTSEFLRRSASKVRVTRLVVKYGATKIAAVIGSVLIVGLCGFYYRDAKQKENENVIARILEEGREFVADPRIDIGHRAGFLIMSEFMEPGAFRKQMDKVPPDQQFDLIRIAYWNFVIYGGNPTLKKQCSYYGDSLVRAVPLDKNDPAFLMERLKALNILVNTSSHYLYFNNDERLAKVLMNALGQTKEIILNAFNQKFDPTEIRMAAIDNGIENILNYNTISKAETRQLLSLISPFESKSAKENFDRYFPRDKQVLYSRGGEQVKHNGGYQQLAYLYSYLGTTETVKACADSLLKDHPNYSTFRNNIVNIATYMFKAGYVDETDELLAYYAQKQKVSKKELYEVWLNLAGYMSRHMAWKIQTGENHNVNLELLDFQIVNKLFDQYLSVLIKEYKNPDARNFNLALYYKHRGVILSKIDSDKNELYQFNPDSLFSKAVESYQKVSKEYLYQSEEIYREDPVLGSQVTQKRRRKELFLYPDHLQKVRNNRVTPPRYYTGKFFDYMLRSGQFSVFNNESNDFELLNTWIFAYNRFNRPNFQSRRIRNYTLLTDQQLANVDSVLTLNPLALGLNSNLVRLLQIDNYLISGKEDKIDAVYKKIDINRLPENFKGGNLQDQLIMAYRVERLTEYLARMGRKQDVFRIIATYSNRNNRIKAYATAPLALLTEKGGPKEDAYVYLDSAMTEFSRVNDFFFFSEDPRISLMLPATMIGGKEMNDKARQFVSKISLGQQSGAMQILTLGASSNDDYYLAYSSVFNGALIDRPLYFNIILSREGAKTMDKEWNAFFNAYRDAQIWGNISYDIEIF